MYCASSRKRHEKDNPSNDAGHEKKLLQMHLSYDTRYAKRTHLVKSGINWQCGQSFSWKTAARPLLNLASIAVLYFLRFNDK